MQAENEEHQCRICFQDDLPENMIRPCNCIGSVKYIHRDCLDEWRATSENHFKKCELCNFVYEVIVDEDLANEKHRKIMYTLYVTRDITIALLLLQTIIVGLGFFIRLMDKHKQFEKPTNIHTFFSYYAFSWVCFLAILGFAGICICCYTGLWRELFRGVNVGNNRRYRSYSPISRSRTSSTGKGDGLAACGMIILLFFAIFGLFFGILISIHVIKQITDKHMKKLWSLQETKKYIVRNRIDEPVVQVNPV